MIALINDLGQGDYARNHGLSSLNFVKVIVNFEGLGDLVCALVHHGRVINVDMIGAQVDRIVHGVAGWSCGDVDGFAVYWVFVSKLVYFKLLLVIV